MAVRSNNTSRWRLVAVCFGLAIGGLILGAGLIIAAGILLIGILGVEPTPLLQLGVSLVAIQGIAFPTVAIGYFRYKNRSLKEFIPLSSPSFREIAIVVGGLISAFVLTSIIGTILITVIPVEPASNAAGQTAQENPEIIPFLIPLVFLLNAPGEELLFRGVIQGLLRERFSAWGAILIATTAFAPLHIIALIGSPTAAVLTITLLSIPSIVFGYSYEITDNLVVPSLIHALLNSSIFLGIYLTS